MEVMLKVTSMWMPHPRMSLSMPPLVLKYITGGMYFLLFYFFEVEECIFSEVAPHYKHKN